MVPIMVLGVLIFDTSLVTISRLRRGRPIYQGGSDHTSHRLVQLGMSQPRAVLTLYVVAAALGALALFLIQEPVIVANAIFAALCLAGGLLLLALERVEPKLTGDPPVVVILAGEADWGAFVRGAHGLSHNLTLLLAPCQAGAQVQPTTAQVTEAVAALAEDSAAVKALLACGLTEQWWRQTPLLNHALRLTGTVLTLYEAPLDAPPTPEAVPPANLTPQAEAAAAIRRAKLILLGPGDPKVNLLPALAAPGLRAALEESRGDCLWLDGDTQAEKLDVWLNRPLKRASPTTWPEQAQKLLLAQAANRAKTVA
jgi:hypothetical protein